MMNIELRRQECAITVGSAFLDVEHEKYTHLICWCLEVLDIDEYVHIIYKF